MTLPYLIGGAALAGIALLIIYRTGGRGSD